MPLRKCHRQTTLPLYAHSSGLCISTISSLLIFLHLQSRLPTSQGSKRQGDGVLRSKQPSNDCRTLIAQILFLLTSILNIRSVSRVTLPTLGFGLCCFIVTRMVWSAQLPTLQRLLNTQRRYSQIQKDSLSVIYGLNKFYQFPYGRKFILVIDHKSLVSLFSPTKGTPALTANRLARWALTQSQYSYAIEYRKTADHGNADAPSR